MKKLLFLTLLTPFLFSSQTINLSCDPIDTLLCADSGECLSFTSQELLTAGFPRMEKTALTIKETDYINGAKVYMLDVGFGLELADKVGNVIKISRDGDTVELKNDESFVGKMGFAAIDVITKEYKYTVVDKKTNLTEVTATWSCDQTSSLLD